MASATLSSSRLMLSSPANAAKNSSSQKKSTKVQASSISAASSSAFGPSDLKLRQPGWVLKKAGNPALETSRSTSRSRKGYVQASADAAVAVPDPAPAPPAPVWKGAAMKPLGIMVAVGVAIWFCPRPEGVARNAWQLLAIFLATIVGIITQVSRIVCVVTKILWYLVGKLSRI